MVCSGGIATEKSFGGDLNLLADYGWYQENSAQWLHTVGRLWPNVRGLFDIHGNLSKWCHNRFGRFGEEPLVIDPLGSDRDAIRVLRGGSWNGDAAYCRAAYRSADAPTSRDTNSGLRLALSPSVQTAAEPGRGAEPVGEGTEGVAEQRP